jgi:hypothetical protein
LAQLIDWYNNLKINWKQDKRELEYEIYDARWKHGKVPADNKIARLSLRIEEGVMLEHSGITPFFLVVIRVMEVPPSPELPQRRRPNNMLEQKPNYYDEDLLMPMPKDPAVGIMDPHSESYSKGIIDNMKKTYRPPLYRPNMTFTVARMSAYTVAAAVQIWMYAVTGVPLNSEQILSCYKLINSLKLEDNDYGLRGCSAATFLANVMVDKKRVK